MPCLYFTSKVYPVTEEMVVDDLSFARKLSESSNFSRSRNASVPGPSKFCNFISTSNDKELISEKELKNPERRVA